MGRVGKGHGGQPPPAARTALRAEGAGSWTPRTRGAPAGSAPMPAPPFSALRPAEAGAGLLCAPPRAEERAGPGPRAVGRGVSPLYAWLGVRQTHFQSCCLRGRLSPGPGLPCLRRGDSSSFPGFLSHSRPACAARRLANASLCLPGAEAAARPGARPRSLSEPPQLPRAPAFPVARSPALGAPSRSSPLHLN